MSFIISLVSRDYSPGRENSREDTGKHSWAIFVGHRNYVLEVSKKTELGNDEPMLLEENKVLGSLKSTDQNTTLFQL